jgi:hypothetical protein
VVQLPQCLGLNLPNSLARQARQRAERSFSREERARDGRNAMMEYEAHARATREKTARSKALRLAKEAEPQTETPLASGRPARRKKIAAL